MLREYTLSLFNDFLNPIIWQEELLLRQVYFEAKCPRHDRKTAHNLFVLNDKPQILEVSHDLCGNPSCSLWCLFLPREIVQ